MAKAPKKTTTATDSPKKSVTPEVAAKKAETEERFAEADAKADPAVTDPSLSEEMIGKQVRGY